MKSAGADTLKRELRTSASGAAVVESADKPELGLQTRRMGRAVRGRRA